MDELLAALNTTFKTLSDDEKQRLVQIKARQIQKPTRAQVSKGIFIPHPQFNT